MNGAQNGVGTGRRVMVGAVRWAELCPTGNDMLRAHGFEIDANPTTVPYGDEETRARARDADAAISGVEEWNEQVFQQAPKLRIIARLGVGLDNVDLASARRHGIDITNAPGGNAGAVGELALTLTLAVLRNLPSMVDGLKRGDWNRYVGTELRGKMIGLVGFGATAREFARILRGFDCTILAYDPYAGESVFASMGVIPASLDQVISADVVSVHLPHLPQTHHFVDSSFLKAMRPHAILVNTSRGGVIDEVSLVAALRNGVIAGAGLDVFETEPLSPQSPLLSMSNVVATPHAAADTYEAYERIGVLAATEIINEFSGKPLTHLAN